MYNVDLEKTEDSEIKLPTSSGWEKSQGNSRKKKKKNLLHWLLKSLYVNHNKLWEIIEEMGILDHPTYLLRNLYASQEATVRTLHGTADWLKIGKGVHQGCILSPACLTYMQSTSCETTVWVNHKLKPRLPGEISTTSDMQMIPV